MAKKSANFIDLHAEKVVLGICAAALIAAGVYSFGGMRFKEKGRGPADLVEEAGKAADDVQKAIARGTTPKAEPGKKPDAGSSQPLIDWIKKGPQALVDAAAVQQKLWRTQKFPPVRTGVAAVAPEDRRDLVKAATPGVPIVMSDRRQFDMPESPSPGESGRGGEPSSTSTKSVTRCYASVGVQVDTSEQELALSAAKYPQTTRLSIVRVQLQRKDESEPWRGWEDVETYVPVKLPERPVDANGNASLAGLVDFKRMLDGARRMITRPDLPCRGATYPPLPSLDPESGPGRVKKFLDTAKKAKAGKKPFTQVDLDAAYLNLRAAAADSATSEKDLEVIKKEIAEVEGKMPKGRPADWKGSPQAVDRLIPLMAHDLDVEPGHSYVYRVRYEILNPSAGVPADMKDGKDANRLTVFSDWSPPSRSVEVTSDLVFFLTQADPKKKDVMVTVFKKTRTGWKDQEYKVKVGEAIGQKEKAGKNKGTDFSTGVICVDLDFARLDPAPGGKKTVAMVYVDPADGKLRQKYLSRDLKDKEKVVKQLADQPTAMK